MANESTTKDGPKSWVRQHSFNIVVGGLIAIGGSYLIASGNWHRLVLSLRNLLRSHPESIEVEPSIRHPIEITLVDGMADTIQFKSDDPTIPPTVVAKPASAGVPLQLLGSLQLDPDAYVPVHSRFPGEVVRIGMVDENGNEVPDPDPNDDVLPLPGSDEAPVPQKPVKEVRQTAFSEKKSAAENKDSNLHGLRMGDRVRKGQLLAVVWSKEIGEKKSELVDAISKLNLSKRILERLLKLKPGVVSGQALNEAERDYESDMVAMQRAERTLRSWRLTEEEISQMRQEAERLHEHQRNVGQQLQSSDSEMRNLKMKLDPVLERQWAQVEIRSPRDGEVLDRSFNVGQIVKSDDDLFKIGEPRRLRIVTFIYEEDLPYVRSLPPEQRIWRVDLKSDPNDKPITAHFDVIGKLIDPQMHTGVIMGKLNDPEGRFASGQFVTCTIDRAPDHTLVEVPTSAIIENGETSSVFVQAADGSRKFTRRRINPVRRGRRFTRISSATEGLPAGVETLKPGEVLISSGVLELSVELDNLKSSARTSATNTAAGSQ